MAVNSFFFDTYALIEIAEGGQNYRPYSKDVGIVTTKMNLVEMHFSLLKTLGVETANRYLDIFSEYLTEITNEDIIEANQFKLKNNKKDLSYVDCLGYVIAKRLKIRFLTGDRKFKEIEDNVEFVKKGA